MTDSIIPEDAQQFTQQEEELAEEIITLATLYARAVSRDEEWGVRSMALAARQILLIVEERGIQCIATRRADA